MLCVLVLFCCESILFVTLWWSSWICAATSLQTVVRFSGIISPTTCSPFPLSFSSSIPIIWKLFLQFLCINTLHYLPFFCFFFCNFFINAGLYLVFNTYIWFLHVKFCYYVVLVFLSSFSLICMNSHTWINSSLSWLKFLIKLLLISLDSTY